MRTAPFSLPPGLGPIATFDAPGPAFSYLFRRFLAILIDLFPFSMAALIWHAWSGLPVSDDFKAMLNSPEIIVLGTALNISYLLYCILMEGIAGATMGKMAMHLRVVGDKGRKATWREIALRNVTKVPETIPTILLLTLLFPILTRLHQRLGDRIAWTAVIDSRAKALPIPPPLPGNMV
jgi:uncharacterized RDD family membrane protein YckC